MFRRLELVLLLAVSMLCVPALTRVMQQLAPATQAGQASGFSRSCDAPPDRVEVSTTIAVTTAMPSATDRLPAPPPLPGADRPASDDALPSFPVVSPPDSLRAPPSRLA
jgi:hypothetical protein